MDPIAAFALAGTVVTFVDFSSKLVLGARELYKSTSGALSANEELELATSDLRSVLIKIQAFSISPNGPSQDLDFDQTFADMCENAKALAEELLDRFEKLKIEKDVEGLPRVWKSLSHAASSAWSISERKALENKLRNLKKMIEMRILLSLRYAFDLYSSYLEKLMSMFHRQNFDVLSVKVSEGFEKLDQQTQYIVSALAQDNISGATSDAVEQTATLTMLLARIEINNSQEHRITREMIAAAGNREVIPSIDVLEVPHNKEIRIRQSVGNDILKDLHFKTMTHRYEEVAEAHQTTFNWIFDESTDEQKPWANFSEWLRNGEGVYWIRGKAGSGKSVLMRHIVEDPRTRQNLRTWASGNLPLHFGSFFFWLSGTREQKSQQGLLRSLLFQVLNQRPGLIPVVFPLLWARSYTGAVSNMPGVFKEAWTLRSLKDAFRLLVNQEIVPIKLCLFIDGLDEFDGDHEEMSELFKNITSANVKVCLSSRPWVVFEECFRGLPSLRLQDLTRPDIEIYVEKLLAGNPAFRRLAVGHPLLTTAFTEEIVEKADGVFLWVVLVVRSLLNGIRNRDAILDLQLRLHRIPGELEPLYSHLLSLIEPEYLPWASRIFQILRMVQQLRIKDNNSYTIEVEDASSTEGVEKPNIDEEEQFHNGLQTLTILGLYLSLDESSYSVQAVRSWSSDTIKSLCEDIAIQLKARCAGLVEIWHVGSSGPNSQIQYLHRTARDYILRPQVWETLLSHTPAHEFSPHISIARSYIFQTGLDKISPTEAIGGLWSVEFRALIHTYLAEDGDYLMPQQVLYNLEQIILQSMKIGAFSRSTHWTRKMTRGLPHSKSFLTIAAMFSLTSCLQRLFSNASREEINGASLLHYAIPRDCSVRHVVLPRPSTIELLLQNCDPNLFYKNKSPWQQAISYARGQKVRLDDWSERTQFLRVLTLMLNSGADPHACIQVHGSLYKITNFIHDVGIEMGIEMTNNKDTLKGSSEALIKLTEAYHKALKDSIPNKRETLSAKYNDDIKQSKKGRLRAWFKK